LLNLKQGLGGWQHFWDNVILFPFFVFPVLSGLTDISHFLYPVIFPLLAVVALAMIYTLMIYYNIRSFSRFDRAKRSVLVLFIVMFLLLCMQHSTAWTHPRYLLGFYLPLFILMSFFLIELNKKLKGLGVVVLCVLLVFHIIGARSIPRNEVILPSGMFPYEKDILSFCLEKRLEEVFIYGSDDLVNRLTFFSHEEIIFLNPSGYFNRIPDYEEKFKKKSHFPLFASPEQTSQDILNRMPDKVISHFNVYLNVPKEVIKDVYFPYFLR
jgi:hypothetical protein